MRETSSIDPGPIRIKVAELVRRTWPLGAISLMAPTDRRPRDWAVGP
jgi:hypothetical protein